MTDKSGHNPDDSVAACLTENHRSVVFANFHSYDTVMLFSSKKRRLRVVSCGFLGVEPRLFNDALFPVPNHRVGHRCDAPSAGALILPASNSTGASSPLTAV